MKKNNNVEKNKKKKKIVPYSKEISAKMIYILLIFRNIFFEKIDDSI